MAAADALARQAAAAAAQARAERAEADLKVAEAQGDRVRAELSLADTQLNRRTKLLASKVVALEEFDTFQRQFEARTVEHVSELRPVSLGRDVGSRLIVAQGITGKKRLVVNPRDDLVNGLPVCIGHKDFDNPQVAHK